MVPPIQMLEPITDHQIKKLKRFLRVIMFGRFELQYNCVEVSLFKHTYKKREIQALASNVGVGKEIAPLHARDEIAFALRAQAIFRLGGGYKQLPPAASRPAHFHFVRVHEQVRSRSLNENAPDKVRGRICSCAGCARNPA